PFVHRSVYPQTLFLLGALNRLDPDGLKVKLMNDAARRTAAAMQQNPFGRQIYNWLDASPDTYEVWGQQELGPRTYGHFIAGELSEAAMTSMRGGTIRVNDSLCLKDGIPLAGNMAHEFTHAALFDALNEPRTVGQGGVALPQIVEELLPHTQPNGGLSGYNMSPYTPHGILTFYWLDKYQ
ncbi:hypothetical protein ACLESO_48690, partial [Pyxidicoccus sp. 3LG]